MCARTDDPTQHDDPGTYTGWDGREYEHADAMPRHEHEPDDAGTCCRWCGIPAERADLSPDALALLIAYQATDHEGDRARWTVALTQPGINRRRKVADVLAFAGPQDGLAREAAEYGIAPDPADPDAIQRQRELGDVWSKAEHSRHVANHCDPDYYEAHDAHTERELLAGRTDADGRVWTVLPPVYLAGAYAIHSAD